MAILFPALTPGFPDLAYPFLVGTTYMDYADYLDSSFSSVTIPAFNLVNKGLI